MRSSRARHFSPSCSTQPAAGLKTVSLPLSPKLTDADVKRVVDSVLTIITDDCESSDK